MKKKLYQHLPQDQHKEAKANFYEARNFRKDFTKVLQNEIESIYSGLHVDNYDKPGWSAQHADRLGQAKALKRVLAMVELDQDGK